MPTVLFILFLLASAGSAATQVLDPGWDDTAFSDYMSWPESQLANPNTDLGAGSNIRFSLPVWSLKGSSEDVYDLGAGSTSTADLVEGWPSCAVENPIIVTIPETVEQSAGLEPGTWYSRVFKYGCVDIVLEGDQNPPDSSVGARIAGLEKSGDIVVTFQGDIATSGREKTSRVPGISTVGYKAGNLVYAMTVYCNTSESFRFCLNESGLKTLPRALFVVAGLPDE